LIEPADHSDQLMPLVAGTVAFSSATAISIDTGTERVEIDGEFVVAAIGDCDGRTTVEELVRRHGPEARDLIAALLESGAIVDGADAWRIFHRQGSLGTALGRAITEEQLLELQRGRFDPGVVDDGPQLAPSGGAVLDLTSQRKSLLPGQNRVQPSFAELSSLLAATYSVTMNEADASASGSVASAGGLYPLVVHVLARRPVDSLPAGLWWHDPLEQRLHRAGDVGESAESLFIEEPTCSELLASDGPVVFISADLSRPTKKYGARGYRYALIEAGAAMQSAQLAATELGIPLRPIGGIDDGAAHQFLRLPDSAVCLLALIVG
jgi:SagB-type dehydrogenase family enzyme